MSDMTIEQMRDLMARLDRLRAISAEREAASADSTAANKRWNAARERFAAEHAAIVEIYGEGRAPIWLESLHGPRKATP